MTFDFKKFGNSMMRRSAGLVALIMVMYIGIAFNAKIQCLPIEQSLSVVQTLVLIVIMGCVVDIWNWGDIS